MDVWQYILMENIPIPTLYYTHEREVILRDGALLSTSPYLKLKPDEVPVKKRVRFRTCGDMPITGAVESDADTLEKIITEIAASRKTERGTRSDDKRSETSMEDRKKSGYF
jgi:sulfate adenylyltransferase subunit 2